MEFTTSGFGALGVAPEETLRVVWAAQVRGFGRAQWTTTSQDNCDWRKNSGTTSCGTQRTTKELAS